MGFFEKLPLDLMHHLLINYVDQNLNLLEKLRIRAVSSSWNSLLPAIMPKLRSEHLPWMLQQDNTKGASIYTPHDPQNYPLDLPEIQNKIFKGSSYGWVVTLDDINGVMDDIYLINPLTRAQFHLPPRSTFPDIKEYNPEKVGEEYVLKHETTGSNYLSKEGACHDNIRKIVLSSSPTSNDCTAVAMYGNFCQLAYCRLHDKEWTPFTELCTETLQDVFTNVIFHNGKLHALHMSGKLAVYDSIHPEVIFTELVPEVPSHVTRLSPMYLVHCQDLGLVMAARCVNYKTINSGQKDEKLTVKTFGFDLYKLVDSTTNDGSKTWDEIEDIGNNMLYLGLNSSLSIPVTDELKLLGYIRNCIYYTDDEYRVYYRKYYRQVNSDIGICDIEDDSTDYLPGFKCEPEFFWPPPIWVTPSAN